jgi:hypothetical protein
MDAQVFQCRTPMRTVTHILHQRGGQLEWCPITGIDEDGRVCPATACLVEDSGDGACFLVVGGEWGLRLQPSGSADPWDLHDMAQWGATYFLVPGDGTGVRFAN